MSSATVEELVQLRVAPRSRFRVIPLGLDLDRFLELQPVASELAFRRELAVPDDHVLAVFVGPRS